MRSEPKIKHAIAFFDGQNLFYSAREAFGYTYPNYDPSKLAALICDQKGWQLIETRFYTGLPDASDKPFWNHFWNAKLAVMGTRGIKTFTRSLRYRNQAITLPDGTTCTALVGVEKGIDVRIALDVLRLSLDKAYEVALIFSQDQDLSEATEEVKKVAQQQERWLKVACAYPLSPTSQNKRGINNTDWIQISRREYDSCIDPNDYRLKNSKETP
jgi:uncharacterized LabA/DUF88 family protein